MRNKYPGICYRCGLLVEKQAGHFERHNGTWRTFHTRKQAERYVDAMKYSPDFVRYWDDHLARCAMMDDYYMDYADH